jgi:hypothetical protein
MNSKTEKPYWLFLWLVIGSHNATHLPLEFQSCKLHVPAQHVDNERF